MYRAAACLFVVLTGLTFASPQGNADPKANSDKGPAAPPPSPDIKAILDRLDRLPAELKKIEDQSAKTADLAAEKLAAEINRRLDALHAEIKELRGRVEAVERRPVQAESRRMDTATSMAAVQLVNLHPGMPMTALVNGMLQTVEPGQSMAVPVPAGTVAVQVTQTDATARVRTVAAGQTLVVTMR